jgi:hypothetical protein
MDLPAVIMDLPAATNKPPHHHGPPRHHGPPTIMGHPTIAATIAATIMGHPTIMDLPTIMGRPAADTTDHPAADTTDQPAANTTDPQPSPIAGEQFRNPLTQRYSTVAMSANFSEEYRARLFRWLWTILAREQCALGITTITPQQIDEMRQHINDVDLDAVHRAEQETRPTTSWPTFTSLEHSAPSPNPSSTSAPPPASCKTMPT